MIKKIGVFLLVFLGLFFLALQEVVLAESSSFSVVANLPENQIDQEKTFFDLKVKAGDKQTLSLNLMNDSTTEQTYLVEANSAYTNGHGMISYDQKERPKTVAAPIFFSDIAKVREPEITLKPNQTKEILIDLIIPKEGFKGLILGGLYIYQPQSQEENEKEAGIRTTQSVVKGVRLTNKIEKIKPSLSLYSLKANLASHSNVSVCLENEEPMIMDKVRLSAQILQRGKQALIISELKLEAIKLAPYARFPIKIPLSSNVAPGEYLVKIIVNSHDEQWSFDEVLFIQGEKNEIKQTILQPKVRKDRSLCLFLLFILLVLLILIYLIFRYKKKSKSKHKNNE